MKEVNISKTSVLDWSFEDVEFFQNQAAADKNMFDETAENLNLKEPLISSV